MSAAGVGNEFARLKLPACGLALLLAGCAGLPPFNQKPVVMRAPAPPQVLSANSTTKNLPPCPQVQIAQAQWLARNMARTRLGQNKLQVVSVLGDPAHAEVFSLTNGAAVEVLFYHTPETICRVNIRDGVKDGLLMPLVFQDDRLLGYGPNYYRDFIVPMMRPVAVNANAGAANEAMQGVPQPRVNMTPAPSLRPAPARTGRLMQEDLPRAIPASYATPPEAVYDGPTTAAHGNGYTAPMTERAYDGYYEPRPAASVGRGEPLQ